MIGFRFVIILLLLYVDIKIANAQEISAFNYPKDNTCDTFFNKSVADPMRWLENLKSAKTTEWLVYEDSIWQKHKSKIKREISKAKSDIVIYKGYKHNMPLADGNYYFKFYYEDFNAPPALYYSFTKEFEKYKLLFSPYDISSKDEIEIDDYKVSLDSKYIAVSFSRNGSDFKEIIVINLNNREFLKDHIYNVAYSKIEWRKNGFLYTSYSVDNKFGSVKNPIVKYHELNTNQENDITVFKKENAEFLDFDYDVAFDSSTILLKEVNEIEGKFKMFQISIVGNKPIISPFINNMPLKHYFDVIYSNKDTIIAYTNYLSPNGSVVFININNPKNWKQIIAPYQDAVLMDVILLDNNDFICTYRLNATNDIVTKINFKGEIIQVAKIEEGFTIDDIIQINDDNYYIGADFPAFPKIVYNLRLKDLKLEIKENTRVNFNSENIIFSLESYKVDSVEVPILIIRNKKVQLDGNNPLILEAYGGFGTLTNHSYDPGLIHFLKEGGVYAYVYVRGGGDFGLNWELGGKRLNKINTINDFIGAAEYLIKQKYTNTNKIATTGASHGGMLVAAAMIKRPDLFKVVIPKMGKFDMIRGEEFTVGNFHIDEYGTTKNEKDFLNLLSYSPFHNIDTTINYPTTLLICGDNDERTTPFQTYKFAARLQKNPAQKNPILLKVIKNAGHYGSNGSLEYEDDLSEEYGFILNQLKQP